VALAAGAEKALNRRMFDMKLHDEPGTSGQHEFVERPHSTDFASMIGGAKEAAAPGAFGVTLRIAQEERQPICALPGCGRGRDDPIHWAPERPEP
jgi:hypothetical protein